MWVAAAGVLGATLITSAGHADDPDISAHWLVESWHDENSGMRIVAEVIASAFASGFSRGGDARESGAYALRLISEGAKS